MSRAAMILSLVAFTLFNYGQFHGWSLFSEVADAQPLRPGSAARLYHK